MNRLRKISKGGLHLSINDVGELLMLIQAYYPTWKPEIPMESIAKAWLAILKNYDRGLIENALMLYVSKGEHFPPSNPGELISLLVEVETETDTEMQAWGMVHKALKRANYYADEEFAALPPVIQRAVGSPDELRAWAVMDPSEVGTVVQSNFMRSYRAAKKREQLEAKAPQAVAGYIKTTEAPAIETKAEPAEEWREEGVPMPDGFMERFEAMMAGGGE